MSKAIRSPRRAFTADPSLKENWRSRKLTPATSCFERRGSMRLSAATLCAPCFALAAERDRLRVVDDQIGCPTYAPDIASAIIGMARKLTNSGWHSDFAGVTHLAGPDALTWCAFAREIIRESAERGGRFVPVDPISTSDYPTAALRPANSTLSTERLSATFGIRLPPMRESLSDCLDRLLQPKQGKAS